MQPTSSNNTDNGTPTDTEITDNLVLLEKHLPEGGLARILVQARRLAPEDRSGLDRVINKRLEQLREGYAEAADQED